MNRFLFLYDLAGAEDDRRFSPSCWRARLALAHKGLPVQTIPWRLTEKQKIAPSRQGCVPVLIDGPDWIHDSWSIATHLEAAYPKLPSLFGGADGLALSRFYANLADTIAGGIFKFVAADNQAHLHPVDRAYFRSSREQRLGVTLEEFTADRDDCLPEFRASLSPLRVTLAAQPYLGGARPLYADYAVFSPFQWARCISPFALLAPDDPITHWRDRMLDAFGGLARSAPGYEVQPNPSSSSSALEPYHVA